MTSGIVVVSWVFMTIYKGVAHMRRSHDVRYCGGELGVYDNL